MTSSPAELLPLLGVEEPSRRLPPDEPLSHAILREEISRLNQRLPDMNKFRDYYEGEQTLVFGSEKFRQKYGEQFAGFKDNWTKPVVDSRVNRLRVEGLAINEALDSGVTAELDMTPEELALQIWTVMARNNWDEQQDDLHQGALVEGRSYVIVWPDPILGARVHWNPGQNVIVRRTDDGESVAWAVRRWLTPSDDIRVNLYLPDRIEKYREIRNASSQDQTRSHFTETIADSSSAGFEFLSLIDNPLGEVPVVEFRHRSGSLIKDVVAQQDAVNYLIITTLIGAGLSGWKQKVMMTNVNEPAGGWNNDPGVIWQLPHTYDPDGNAIDSKIGEFSATNLDQHVNVVQEVLRHIAATTSTPMRLFFHSDRGGRGDAPSGESQRVDDEPLIDSVEAIQRIFGNRHYEVFRLVAKAARLTSVTPFPVGEPYWRNPQARHMSILLQDAVLMKDLGIPFDFYVEKLGLSPLEIRRIQTMREDMDPDELRAISGLPPAQQSATPGLLPPSPPRA